MNSCSSKVQLPDAAELQPEIRRCRPLLGTFVDITAQADAPNWSSALLDAVNVAFAAVENIQRLMSAHDEASELSLLNREAAAHPVVVSRETYEVLRRAQKLAAESDGAFDFTVAPMLARWGLLPTNLRRKEPGGWREVELLPGRKVRFLRPLALDLGGIAKGFAVDAAIEVLRTRGVTSAVVNAGGDLRVLGSQPATIHLRHPAQPQTFARTIALSDGALATSSPCFTERSWRGQRVSHLVNSSSGGAITGNMSVTVRAEECWLADALTKVVLNAPRRAKSLLAKYEAEAFILAV